MLTYALFARRHEPVELLGPYVTSAAARPQAHPIDAAGALHACRSNPSISAFANMMRLGDEVIVDRDRPSCARNWRETAERIARLHGARISKRAAQM